MLLAELQIENFKNNWTKWFRVYSIKSWLVEAIFTILFIKQNSIWKREMVMNVHLLWVPISGIESF